MSSRMTTMQLIERGVGHNCLSDAYELGRADREKEICDFLKEIANGDDVNTKLLELIKEQKNGTD